jgi:hypothetical protein
MAAERSVAGLNEYINAPPVASMADICSTVLASVHAQDETSSNVAAKKPVAIPFVDITCWVFATNQSSLAKR